VYYIRQEEILKAKEILRLKLWITTLYGVVFVLYNVSMNKTNALKIAIELLREIEATYDAGASIEFEEINYDIDLFNEMIYENPELLDNK